MTRPGKPLRANHIVSLPPIDEKLPGFTRFPEVAAVVTVTVILVGAEPLSVTVAGTEQTEPAGAPLQVKETD
jgi:hypothetical protein